MTLFLKQCWKLIFLPSTVSQLGTAKASKPIFSTKRNLFFFYKSMRNSDLKIVAFRKWALQLSRKIGMINAAARNLVNPVCTFGPERVQMPADLFKSVQMSQDLLGVCSDVNFLHHQHGECRNLQGEVDNRQQRSFTCFLSRKLQHCDADRILLPYHDLT